MSKTKNSEKNTTSFSVLGIEFSGPTWLALVFILFSVFVIYFLKGRESKEVNVVKQNPIEITKQKEDPCDVEWNNQPLSCKK